MRINIVINDELMNKAIALSGLKTKKEVVDRALYEFVDSLTRMELSDLMGKIKFTNGYDYKSLRESE